MFLRKSCKQNFFILCFGNIFIAALWNCGQPFGMRFIQHWLAGGFFLVSVCSCINAITQSSWLITIVQELDKRHIDPIISGDVFKVYSGCLQCDYFWLFVGDCIPKNKSRMRYLFHVWQTWTAGAKPDCVALIEIPHRLNEKI